MTFALVSMTEPFSFHNFSSSEATALFLKNEFFEVFFDVHLYNFSLLLTEKTKRETERDRDRDREQRERQRETEREAERDRETERQRE